MELNEDPPSAPKVLAPLKAPPPTSPLLNGHSSIEEDMAPPNYDSIVMTPLVRGAPERESSTSRDLLLGPNLWDTALQIFTFSRCLFRPARPGIILLRYHGYRPLIYL